MSTTENSPAATAVGGIRTLLAVSGAVALIVGILILVWPGKAAAVLTAILAIYAIVGGLVYAGLGIFSKMGGWARVGHIVLGLVFIVAGIVAFTNLAATAATFVYIVVLMIGITWIIEGVVALTALGGAKSKGWSIFFAIVSIIAGIMVIFAPLWAAAVMWLFFGISLVAIGVVQIIRAFTFKPGETLA